MNQKYIYIVISKTETNFGRCLRMVGRLKYNHSAIGLDSELNELYAFARPHHHSVFMGRLVRETLDRYTLRKNHPVPVVVLRIALSKNEYEHVSSIIKDVSNDPEYMYNLFSVLTYPITRGFSTYKAFSCTEFVFHVLKELKYPLQKRLCSYKPDDLLEMFETSIVYQGDLRDYMICNETNEKYFSPLSWKLFYLNLWAMMKIIYRSCRRGQYSKNIM